MRRWLSSRRGLLAGVVALAAAGLAKLTGPERAEATHGGPPPGAADGIDTRALHVHITNPTLNTTSIKCTGTFNEALAGGLFVNSTLTRGIIGAGGVSTLIDLASASDKVGVWGISYQANAVRGESRSGTGVFGLSVANNSHTVAPSTMASGTAGFSDTKIGVLGQSTSNAGVYGKSQSNAGVFGDSPLVAVAGVSLHGLGVQGTSTTNAGLFGQSTYNAAIYGTSPYAGVYGTSSAFGVWGASNGGTAVFGQSTGAGGWAAQFAGNVYISGSLTVASGAKSAAVKKKDGSMARVYCQESPEPWFEDFGTADLKNGQASVALDPESAEVVKGDDYRVFVTPIGVDCSLYVSRMGPNRFEVRSVGGAAVSGTFHYRIVARRAEAVGARLEKIDVPAPSATREQVKAPQAAATKDLPAPVDVRRVEGGQPVEVHGR